MGRTTNAWDRLTAETEVEIAWLCATLLGIGLTLALIAWAEPLLAAFPWALTMAAAARFRRSMVARRDAGLHFGLSTMFSGWWNRFPD